MQLEAGKYYKTRDGRKVGPMVKKWTGEPDGDEWGYEGSSACYDKQGIRWVGAYEPESDLIAEWTDEPAQAALTAIDHLRKAAELFLAAGNDKAAFDVLGVVLDHE